VNIFYLSLKFHDQEAYCISLLALRLVACFNFSYLLDVNKLVALASPEMDQIASSMPSLAAARHFRNEVTVLGWNLEGRAGQDTMVLEAFSVYLRAYRVLASVVVYEAERKVGWRRHLHRRTFQPSEPILPGCSLFVLVRTPTAAVSFLPGSILRCQRSTKCVGH